VNPPAPGGRLIAAGAAQPRPNLPREIQTLMLE